MIAGDDTAGRGEAFEEARAGLVGRLRARQGEIERVIFARISDEQFDLTGSENAEYVAGLRAAIVAALDHVLTGIEHGVKESTESVPAAAIEQARRAARLGVGLDTVLRRYVAGYSQLEGFIMGEVERDRSLGTVMLRDVLGRAGMLVEGLISAVSDAYQREVERSDRTAPPGGSTVVSRGGPASSSRAARKGARQGRAATAGARRQRIVEAVVEVVAERGSTGASVGLVIERARVSRRTFYEVFPGGIEDGLNAVMDWVLERSVTLVSQRLEQAGSWQDGVREALAALLLFFDSDSALARVCFVETLGGGTAVVEHRERNLRALRSLIVARIESEDVRVQPLAAESVMASVMGVIYNRLLNREPGPLIELLGPLMGTAVTPFVASERMALAGRAPWRRARAGNPNRCPRLGARVDLAGRDRRVGEAGWRVGAARDAGQPQCPPRARMPRLSGRPARCEQYRNCRGHRRCAPLADLEAPLRARRRRAYFQALRGSGQAQRVVPDPAWRRYRALALNGCLPADPSKLVTGRSTAVFLS